MGAKENYEARKVTEKASREADKSSRWWFNQRVPIDRFTGWLVAWTFLLFIATIGSAAILWKTDNTLHETLTETKKAAEAAETSANAAKAAVELSDKTAERQLRAYINVESTSLAWSGITRSTASINIRNAGQTPAKNVIVRGIIADINDAPPNRLPAYFGDAPSSIGMGEPDSSKVTKILGQGRDETHGIYSSTISFTKTPVRKGKPVFPGRVFVIGAVYYTDIFGKQRFTRFCLYYVTAADPNYCTEHNDAN